MINVIISSTILILGILLIRFLFKEKMNPKLRYGLWSIVVLRLVMFDFPLAHIFKSPLSVENVTTLAQKRYLVKELLPVGVEFTPIGTEAINAGTSNYIEMNATLNFNWQDWMLWIWIIGIAIFFIWFITVNFFFSKKVFQTRELLLFEAVGVDLMKLPIYVSDHLNSPCLIRYKREIAIYVTRDTAKDDEKLYYAVIHELCHKKHHDIFWGYMRIILVSIYWFHPFVWISAIISKRDCESACDYQVIGIIGEEKRIEYGKVLLSLAQSQQRSKLIPLQIATMMFENEKGIKSRIKQIAKSPRMLPITLVAVLLLVAIFMVATFTGKMEEGVDSKEVGIDLEESLELDEDDKALEGQLQQGEDKALEEQLEQGEDKALEEQLQQGDGGTLEEQPILGENGIVIRGQQAVGENSISLEKQNELVDFTITWAEAYRGRDADKIYELCADKKLYETIGYTEIGYRWLGGSSPWPSQTSHSYLAVVGADGSIKVYYSHAELGDPSIFVEIETLEVKKNDGVYQVIARESKNYKEVTSKADFEEAYQYRYPIFSEWSQAFQSRTDENSKIKDDFYDPIKMAEHLLNIVEANAEILSQEEGKAQIEFSWEDGSVIVKMIQPDIIGDDGIWLVEFEDLEYEDTEQKEEASNELTSLEHNTLAEEINKQINWEIESETNVVFEVGEKKYNIVPVLKERI